MPTGASIALSSPRRSTWLREVIPALRAEISTSNSGSGTRVWMRTVSGPVTSTCEKL